MTPIPPNSVVAAAAGGVGQHSKSCFESIQPTHPTPDEHRSRSPYWLALLPQRSGRVPGAVASIGSGLGDRCRSSAATPATSAQLTVLSSIVTPLVHDGGVIDAAVLDAEPVAADAGATERSLDDRLADACGQLNASYAELADVLSEAIAADACQGWGIRTKEQWIMWRTGLSRAHVDQLVALVEARHTHSRVSAAFSAGQLSIDQARLAIRARPDHDETIADWAKVMTLPQLRLAVRASVAAAPPAPPGPDGEGVKDDDPSSPAPTSSPAHRPDALHEFVSLRPEEDGTWRLAGRLDADHGAVVEAALGEARERLFGEGNTDVTSAEALVDIAQRSLDSASVGRRERFRLNVFVDPENSPVATWTNGAAVPDVLARLLTCDGVISPIFVSDGRPVSVGRSQRIVPERTRRVVLHRDKQQCRNPLCGATRNLDVHHVVHWVTGHGRTDPDNLIVLCRRCHRDHHLGRLDITGSGDEPDGIVFRDEHGRRLDPATHARRPTGPPPTPDDPYRHPLGERLRRGDILYNPIHPPDRN